MSENNANMIKEWSDEDDAPELTDDMLAMGEIRNGGRIVQRATGVLTKDGMQYVDNLAPIPFPMRGRPPLGDEAKQQVSLRLDSEVVAWFRNGGKGWQTRMNEALRKAAGV